MQFEQKHEHSDEVEPAHHWGMVGWLLLVKRPPSSAVSFFICGVVERWESRDAFTRLRHWNFLGVYTKYDVRCLGVDDSGSRGGGGGGGGPEWCT
ncbi:hypothetical protein T4B_5516 [Trichinella pseudospiralis]|uniref:Uncharacterized protein n=2 Tax=Trichinella pseudospiralis TaxID=6337 RepID=A0A0V0YL73_TRIPS|nr:hypothetical protein T4E_3195 [Trichinella pseudospiralis]KRY78319.1 hypothetical protein T4A_456 [Trichinella pseudospiralis]KRY91571.1 hypothetical protein T4D_8644 [Trichinella pseudospiralis]KRZ34086.1 hypothetical protein T4B_5516 [Trichinella pseudospiralis]